MSIFKNYKSKQAERRQRIVKKIASQVFQITEYGGEVWITYDNCLICPASMFSTNPIDTLKKLREMYIQRHE